MTSGSSDSSVQELVAILLKYQKLEIAASERDDIDSANRYFDRLSAALDQLATTSPGRDTLERLMQHEMPEIRLRAAGRVMAWAPEMAIPVLGRLLVDWKPRDPRKGYVAVGDGARMRLYQHFGIRSYNRNDLIEPLRRYGIELPPRSGEIWT